MVVAVDEVGVGRFFERRGPHSISTVAKAAKGIAADTGLMLTGVGPLHSAHAHQVSFLDNRRYASALEATLAGAVIVHPDMLARVPKTAVAIVTRNPYEGWALVATLFHPAALAFPSIHSSAFVHETAKVDLTAEIGAFCSIEAGAEIGAGCKLGSHVSIGPGVVLGRDCRIGTNASISHAVLGTRVYVYPGARIGQEGFSFASTDCGFMTVPQLGRVILEDDVEVGANSAIDRGSVQDTVIGTGTRLDNLVQIGHNVRVGRYCVVVAQVGIAGSTVVEDFVQIGGQAAIAGHLRIGEGAKIGAQAGVISDLPPHTIVLGSPAQPRIQFFRQAALLKRMASPRDKKPNHE